MQCLCQANDNLELALEALYERFGREQFFEDNGDIPKLKEIIEAVQYAQFELEEYLESLGSDEEDEEAEGEPEKGVTSFGNLA
jgi:hypothetical protein